MSKGIASHNSLKALAYPLQQFLATWGVQQRGRSALGSSNDAWPAPYELAALRGEAVLRLRFLDELMDKLPVQLQAQQQLALWQDLVEDGGHVTDWVQRLGVARALQREAALPQHAKADARKLYAILLDALQTEAPELLPWAVEGFFVHVWKRQFPTAPSAGAAQAKTTDAVVLRDRLERALRRHFKSNVAIRESFKEEQEAVDFALLCKPAGASHWAEWVRVQRPRLKTARLAALQAGLDKTTQTAAISS